MQSQEFELTDIRAKMAKLNRAQQEDVMGQLVQMARERGAA